MCGIAGIVNFDFAEKTEPLLRRMLTFMRHRGPDSFGIYEGDSASLGSARLSIIDLDTGDQPIHNEDRSIRVVLNGEIFNYPELRSDLKSRGHRFYTRSDTEVLVHLYEERGTDLFEALNGQFAFALWDQTNERLLQIPPGHYGIFSREGFRMRPYWQISFQDSSPWDRPLEEWVEELRALVLDAAKIRLRADVPVGA
jgi:asparagine synthase (glutamine-hydrolysing)